MDAIKTGAYDYRVQSLDVDQIDQVLDRCFRERALRRRASHFSDEAAENRTRWTG